MLRLFLTLIALIVEPFLKIGAHFLSFALNKNGNAAAALIRGRIYGWYWGCKRLKLEHNVLFVYPKHISLADGVTIYNNVNISAHPNGTVRIGQRSHIAKDSIIAGYAGVTIGEACSISSGVRIYTTSNGIKDVDRPMVEQREIAPVSIGNNVLIGANVVVLPGVVIGDHSVIAAGSVVNKNVGAYEIVGGQPIRLLRNRLGNEAKEIS
ncbi:MAG: acyltransferase [Bacteroidota bacterium]